MKPALILRTYTWLYYIICNHGPLTFNEINEMWVADKRLSEGKKMIRQTFARHRNDLEEIFGVRIDCDKNHRYFIANEQQSYGNTWALMLDAAINQMLKRRSEIGKRIILEPKFIENNFFALILECMRMNVMVDIDYQSTEEILTHYQRVEPYYIRQCTEHWFLIGRMRDGSFLSFALDKILDLRKTDIKFEFKDGFSVKCCEETKEISAL